MVSEDVHDFLNPEKIDLDLSVIKDLGDESLKNNDEEPYIEIENTIDQMKKIFRTEIASPEFSRGIFTLQLNDGRTLEGTPMAELSTGNAFLFKINGHIQKIKLPNIREFDLAEEIEKSKSERELDEEYNGYNFIDYLYDISDFIESHILDRGLVGEEDQELVGWLEENQDSWDLQNLFVTGVPSNEIALQILKEFQYDEEE